MRRRTRTAKTLRALGALLVLPLVLLGTTGCPRGGGWGGGGGGGGWGGGGGGGGLPPIGGGGGGFPPPGGTNLGGGGGGFTPPGYTGFGGGGSGGSGPSSPTSLPGNQPGGGPIAGGGSSMPPALGGPGQSDLTAPPGQLGADDYDWRKDLRKVTVQQRNWSANRPDAQVAYVRDVMGSTGDPWQPERTEAIGPNGKEMIDVDTATWVHETTHGIHADISNANGNAPSIYIEGGVGAIFGKVGIEKTQTAQYMAPQVQQLASRFKTYVTDVSTGSPMDGSGRILEVGDATYLFDEWGAYVNGGRAAVEIHKAGLWRQGSVDEVDGMMDFVYFCSAVTAMVMERNPQFFETAEGKAYKAAFAVTAERSSKWMSQGLRIREFSGFHAGQLFQFFQTSNDPQTVKLRQALVQLYGKGWTKRVFGFEQ